MAGARVVVWSLIALLTGASVPLSARQATVPAAGSQELVVLASQHRRLTFASNLERIAVGDTGIAEGQLISNRELLVLGVAPGRTTLIVWFTSGAIQTYTVNVQRDLSLLAAALKRVDPSIAIEIAPDRDAVVLTGTVPNITVSQTAEAITRDYLGASGRQGTAARPSVQSAGATTPTGAGDPANQDQAAPADAPQTGTSRTPAAAAVQLAATPLVPTTAVINLLRLQTLPPLPEETIRDAIKQSVGGQVNVRRVLHGAVRDDAKDTLVLEGTVPNQVALVRALEIASRAFVHQTSTLDDIRVLADEAGAFRPRTQDPDSDQNGASGSLAPGGLLAEMFGGGGRTNRRLTNLVSRNIARAKLIELANGRILSFIKVTDLPQVRVDIRLFEIDRNKLRTFTPQTTLPLATQALGAVPAISPTLLAGAGLAKALQSNAAQSVLGFLGGQLSSETQLVGHHIALDSAFSLLEQQGIARRLSSPSLSVLSGEQAQFLVGGEVPIPTSFATPVVASTGANGSVSSTPGVFSSVEFVPFGVQLVVRPLVDEGDVITLDLVPQIVNPNTDLTTSIRSATGTDLPTLAFDTRGMRTSSRLQDGQSLLIGGLLTRAASENTQGTPGLGSVPGLGRLFKGVNKSDESVELVIMVSPSIVRDPIPSLALWVFPTTTETLDSIGRTLHGSHDGR